MTFGEFLSDRLGYLLLYLICVVGAALFLAATGTQPGVLVILLLILLLVFTAVQLSDFYLQRSRLMELEAVLNGLDQKYLFTECVSRPQKLYERHLFNLIHVAGRSMIGTVSDAKASQREYQEYRV